ncbi:hypothetical protein HH303_05540 [Rhodospirillaceae bacterium KN72]|uniref:Uncharacterized protein n=1 Tax=Pacificispira spongiicola TaxID=2729598 RepID=A0A7Y0HEU6_9PROT|nr:hypothetical protein [Pacificispira spongiicola]NMM43928.1 hypothetical protein [Pacificispira spongiicola]
MELMTEAAGWFLGLMSAMLATVLLLSLVKYAILVLIALFGDFLTRPWQDDFGMFAAWCVAMGERANEQERRRTEKAKSARKNPNRPIGGSITGEAMLFDGDPMKIKAARRIRNAFFE